MIRRLWRYLTHGPIELGSIPDWTAQRAARAAEWTARQQLGWCGPARVVGSRTVEARERRVREMQRRVLRMVQR